MDQQPLPPWGSLRNADWVGSRAGKVPPLEGVLYPAPQKEGKSRIPDTTLTRESESAFERGPQRSLGPPLTWTPGPGFLLCETGLGSAPLLGRCED